VIITKLDTSTAIERHQYRNRFIDDHTFSWTSQNRMGTGNEAGLKVIEHERRGLRLHLFVQPRSHAPACYLGLVRVGGRADAEGSGPMQVRFSLSRSVPADVLKELLEVDSETHAADGTDD
jgi:hypothetical protein